MSIEEHDSSNEAITMGRATGALFKLNVWVGAVFIPIASLAALSMRDELRDHRKDLGDHDRRISRLEVRNGLANSADPTSPAANTNTNTIAINTEPPALPSARDYLTTQEVASREKVTDREVLYMIARGSIIPQPVKSGKTWRIPKEYAIRTDPTERFGTVPNDSEE